MSKQVSFSGLGESKTDAIGNLTVYVAPRTHLPVLDFHYDDRALDLNYDDRVLDLPYGTRGD